jgi:hypothetical protein
MITDRAPGLFHSSTMSSTTSNAASSTAKLGNRIGTFKALKSSAPSQSNWLANLLVTAKVITAAAECLPFPYVRGVFGTVVVVLETVEVW